MATTVIPVVLDIASIDGAIREIERYKQDFIRKCEELRRRVGERIQWSASRGFSSAIVSDVFYGAPPANDVQVTVSDSGDLTVVIADGKEAVFIEFGAGVFHNGGVGMIGQSPHPWGGQGNNYFIGMYGKGHGAENRWYYRDSGGNKVGTRGTPAAMPMYRGMQEAINAIESIVREVFG